MIYGPEFSMIPVQTRRRRLRPLTWLLVVLAACGLGDVVVILVTEVLR